MVERVVVITESNDDEQYARTSSAGGSFTVCTDQSQPVGWGYQSDPLSQRRPEYLEERRTKEVVKKHSRSIGCSINSMIRKTTGQSSASL